MGEFDLRAERRNRGLTLRDLAEQTGLSRQTLIRIERGGVSPTAPTAKALADWMGVQVTDLWPEPERDAA